MHTFQVLNAQCGTFDVTVNPEPIGGIYYPGTVVEYCIDVSLWVDNFYDPSGIGAEYIHGAQPINIGAGWLPLDVSSGTNNPSECSTSAGGVGWQWSNHPTLGWGWYFEAPLDFNPLDNDPSNNHGDSNAAPGNESCQWTFCFEMETAACPPGTDGASLAVDFDVYSDGESGAWTTTACAADPIFNGPVASLVCCSNPQLDISTDAQDGLDICLGSDLDLGAEVDIIATSIPATATDITYYWEGPPSSFWDSNDENPVLQDPTPGQYEVYIEVDGCSSISYEINVNILPTLDLGWSSSNTCDNVEPIVLAPNPGAETGGVWSGDGVTDLGDGTATFDPSGILATSEVTYEIVGTDCDASNTQTINILAAPSVPSVEMVEPICAGETDLPSLVATPDQPGNFVRWYSDSALGIDDFIEENNSIPFPSFIDVNTPGQYSVWAQTVNTTFCFSDAVELIINVVDCSCPAILTSFDEQSLCDGQELTLEVELQGEDLGTLTWIYPDGAIVEEVDAVHTFNLIDPCGELQVLTYELYCDNTDETLTGTVDVMVHPDLDDDSVVIAQIESDECPLISVTSNCPQFDVSLDIEGETIAGLEYQVPSDASGVLYVNIGQADAGGLCTSHEVAYNYSCEIPVVKIPNAFSPNADGMNDCFQLLGADLSEVEMHIFNRWGQEVYYSNDPTACWNGLSEGSVAELGVYVYFVSFTYVDGRVGSEKGNVTLIR